jgi:iron-sulfur cluster repair protein YtfE (RIC family)
VWTDDNPVPEDGCPSYPNMFERFDNLERDTYRHVHEAKDVLFERVSGG